MFSHKFWRFKIGIIEKDLDYIAFQLGQYGKKIASIDEKVVFLNKLPVAVSVVMLLLCSINNLPKQARFLGCQYHQIFKKLCLKAYLFLTKNEPDILVSGSFF